MDTIMWTAVAAVVIGAIVRAIKSDGAKIALANLGLPPVPKRWLPWIALVLGALSAALDARVNGSEWQQAAAYGVLAAGAAITGHDLLKGVPGLGKSLVMVAVFPLALGACGAFGRGAARSALDVAQVACIIAQQERPDEDVAKVCDVFDDMLPHMRRILSESRKASARASAKPGACP